MSQLVESVSRLPQSLSAMATPARVISDNRSPNEAAKGAMILSGLMSFLREKTALKTYYSIKNT